MPCGALTADDLFLNPKNPFEVPFKPDCDSNG